MASKVTKRKGTKPAPKGAGSVNAGTEIDILHPERETIISGRPVVAREYGFVEGMQVQTIARPFFDALYAVHPQANGAPNFAGIMDVATLNYAATAWMMAASIAPPPPPPTATPEQKKAHMAVVEEIETWVHGLDDIDGGLLLSIWWMANVGFFTRLLLRKARIAAASPQAGGGSTPRSSGQDSDEHPTKLDGLQPDR